MFLGDPVLLQCEGEPVGQTQPSVTKSGFLLLPQHFILYAAYLAVLMITKRKSGKLNATSSALIGFHGSSRSPQVFFLKALEQVPCLHL